MKPPNFLIIWAISILLQYYVSLTFGQLQLITESIPGKNETKESGKVKDIDPELIDKGIWPSMEVEPDASIHLVYFKYENLFYATKGLTTEWEYRNLGRCTGCTENDMLIVYEGNILKGGIYLPEAADKI